MNETLRAKNPIITWPEIKRGHNISNLSTCITLTGNTSTKRKSRKVMGGGASLHADYNVICSVKIKLSKKRQVLFTLSIFYYYIL